MDADTPAGKGLPWFRSSRSGPAPPLPGNALCTLTGRTGSLRGAPCSRVSAGAPDTQPSLPAWHFLASASACAPRAPHPVTLPLAFSGPPLTLHPSTWGPRQTSHPTPPALGSPAALSPHAPTPENPTRPRAPRNPVSGTPSSPLLRGPPEVPSPHASDPYPHPRLVAEQPSPRVSPEPLGASRAPRLPPPRAPRAEPPPCTSPRACRTWPTARPCSS